MIVRVCLMFLHHPLAGTHKWRVTQARSLGDYLSPGTTVRVHSLGLPDQARRNGEIARVGDFVERSGLYQVHFSGGLTLALKRENLLRVPQAH